jgi:hypothetical protein
MDVARQYRETHRREIAVRVRQQKYSITPTEHESLFSFQHGVCAICKTPFNGRWHQGPQTDHDHRTNIVRGLLCNECNLRMGLIDNEEWLAKTIKYLGVGFHL